MKQNTFFTLLSVVFLLASINAQQLHQQPSDDFMIPPQPIEVDQIQNQVHEDDPFARRTPPEHKKKHHQKKQHQEFPPEFQAGKDWQTYKPFEEENDEQQPKHKKNKAHHKKFNELLKWGLLAGTAFLAFVLIRTCTQKRGRREMRRIMEESQNRRQNVVQPANNVFYYHPHVQPFNAIPRQTEENLDEKIQQAEIELNRLKELKQKSLRNEFNRKQMQEEQRRVEMVNIQRIQNVHPRQNNWSVGYGPVFYGQQNVPYIQPVTQQAFHVQGVEGHRQRSNSFKTEVSERPIMGNEIKYRNGIPIGKPIRQNDNDSSFASEYPDV